MNSAATSLSSRPSRAPSFEHIRPVALKAPEITFLENQIQRHQRVLGLERLIGLSALLHEDAASSGDDTFQGELQ
jgi:hypothetical protein